MKNRILVVGSILAVAILVFASSPSVVGVQSIDNSKSNRYVNLFANHIQKEDRFKDIDIGKRTFAIQSIGENIIDNNLIEIDKSPRSIDKSIFA